MRCGPVPARVETLGPRPALTLRDQQEPVKDTLAPNRAPLFDKMGHWMRAGKGMTCDPTREECYRRQAWPHTTSPGRPGSTGQSTYTAHSGLLGGAHRKSRGVHASSGQRGRSGSAATPSRTEEMEVYVWAPGPRALTSQGVLPLLP